MTNDRDDGYSSRRDYQHLRDCATAGLVLPTASYDIKLVFTGLADSDSPYVAAGGYLAGSTNFYLIVALTESGTIIEEYVWRVGEAWSRHGFVIEHRADLDDLAVTLSWPAGQVLHVWGLAAGRPALPEALAALAPEQSELNAEHLVPETFYFTHDQPWTLKLIEQPTGLEVSTGKALKEKKCSFCSVRGYLPVDPEHPGRLAFHRHAAKLTKHQNEWRSCKKWRINNVLNSIRTAAQLNEAGILGRERRIFLRDPEIQVAFKQDHGEGLKDFIWRRFGGRCFNCDTELPSSSAMDLDHTRPLAYLWPIDEHATSLCPTCNNQKRDKFPVDFYSDEQLVRLAKVTGLQLADVTSRRVNPHELKQVLDNLPRFAVEWDPRLFRNTAQRICEVEPRIDLFALLREQDPLAYAELRAQLAVRPPSESEEEE